MRLPPNCLLTSSYFLRTWFLNLMVFIRSPTSHFDTIWIEKIFNRYSLFFHTIRITHSLYFDTIIENPMHNLICTCTFLYSFSQLNGSDNLIYMKIDEWDLLKKVICLFQLNSMSCMNNCLWMISSISLYYHFHRFQECIESNFDIRKLLSAWIQSLIQIFQFDITVSRK